MTDGKDNGNGERLDPRAQIVREAAKGGMGMVAIIVIGYVVWMLAGVLKDQKDTNKNIIAAMAKTIERVCGERRGPL